MRATPVHVDLPTISFGYLDRAFLTETQVCGSVIHVSVPHASTVWQRMAIRTPLVVVGESYSPGMVEDRLDWDVDGWQVRVVGGRGIHGQEIILELELTSPDGEFWWGWLATLEMLQERLDYYRRSGECAAGAYFPGGNLIVVRDTEEATFRAAVDDLINAGDVASTLSLHTGPDGDTQTGGQEG